MAVIKRSVSVLRDVMNRVAVLKPKRSVSQILDLLMQEPITKDLELVEIEHNIQCFCGDQNHIRYNLVILTSLPVFFKTGECENRTKRGAVDLQDDTVDDQDAIPAFNPTVTRVNVTLTWPTASGRTKENVTQFCENKLRYSKAGAACGEVEGVDVDGLVQQCITDIQVLSYICIMYSLSL